MLDVVWRIASEDIDLEKFAQNFKIKPLRIFKKGEKRYIGVSKRSGMNVHLFKEQKENINGAIEKFCNKYSKAILFLQENGADSNIDIGVSVGGDVFSRSVVINPKIMGLLNKCNIELEVSAYYSSDDEED